MTGWRLGWMVVPEGLSETLGKLVEFNSSCAPVFVQRGAIAAIDGAQASVPRLREHTQACCCVVPTIWSHSLKKKPV